jgi:hypothetical protein
MSLAIRDIVRALVQVSLVTRDIVRAFRLIQVSLVIWVVAGAWIQVY